MSSSVLLGERKPVTLMDTVLETSPLDSVDFEKEETISPSSSDSMSDEKCHGNNNGRISDQQYTSIDHTANNRPVIDKPQRDEMVDLLTPRVTPSERRKSVLRSAMLRSQEFEKQDRIKNYHEMLKQLEVIRGEMESGIKEMYSRIDQIRCLETPLVSVASLPESSNITTSSLHRKMQTSCESSLLQTSQSVVSNQRKEVEQQNDHWEEMVSALTQKDVFYESSKSGFDHSHDFHPVSSQEGSLIPSPIPTPSLLDSLQRSGSFDWPLPRYTPSPSPLLPQRLHHEKSLFEGCNNMGYQSPPPLPGISAFQMNRMNSTTDEEEAGEDDGDEDILLTREQSTNMERCCSSLSLEYNTSHVQLSARNGLKRNVILNLKGQHQWQRNQNTNEKSKGGDGVKNRRGTAKKGGREHTLDKFIGMLCLKKNVKSCKSSIRKCESASPTIKTSRMLETAKAITRGCGRSTPFNLKKYRRQPKSLGGRKFTDKYPITDSHVEFFEVNQKFCSESKAFVISLDATQTVATLQSGNINRGFVMSSDSVLNGVLRFDLTCTDISGQCFIGILAKPEISQTLETQGVKISDLELCHGWKNAAEILQDKIHHLGEADSGYVAARTHFQVVVDCRVGTIHLRVQKQLQPEEANHQIPIAEYTEYEVCFSPSQMAWNLCLEWMDHGEFQLNSVEAWQ